MQSLLEFELLDFPFPVAWPLQEVHKLYSGSTRVRETVAPMVACLRNTIRYATSLVVAHDLRYAAFLREFVGVLDGLLDADGHDGERCWGDVWKPLLLMLDEAGLVEGDCDRPEPLTHAFVRIRELALQSPTVFQLPSDSTDSVNEAAVDPGWLETTLCKTLHALAELLKP